MRGVFVFYRFCEMLENLDSTPFVRLFRHHNRMRADMESAPAGHALRCGFI